MKIYPFVFMLSLTTYSHGDTVSSRHRSLSETDTLASSRKRVPLYINTLKNEAQKIDNKIHTDEYARITKLFNRFCICSLISSGIMIALIFTIMYKKRV